MTSRPHIIRRHRSGFTMVELLTVIGIIVILVAILLPAVSKVRLQVRVAMTQQEMSKVAGAIDQYYLEFNHAYPGPFSNVQISSGLTSPVPIAVANVNGGAAIIPTSTENMVLGVCGGLEIPNGAIAPFAKLNYNSFDIVSSLGPLNLNPNPSKQSRHVAFIDATPGQQMPDAGNVGAVPPPAPWDAASGGNGKQGPGDSYIPEFMDKFSTYNGGQARPILYLRARVGNPNYFVKSGKYVIADSTANGADAAVQYNFSHLGPYIQSVDFFGFPGLPTGGGTTNATLTNPNVQPYVVASPTSVQIGTAFLLPYSAWDTYLSNPNLPGSPRGVNGYILISAGADGVFGTQDDIFYP